MGKSYLDLISSLYGGRLPCSALVVAWNSVIMPPLQFLGFLIVLLGRQRLLDINDELMATLKTYLRDQAPFRFTNPMVLMTSASFINLTAPSGKMEASFTRGYWYFMTYCATSVVLAWSLNLDDDSASHIEGSHLDGQPTRAAVCQPNSNCQLDNGDMKVQLSKEARLDSQDSYEQDLFDLDSEGGLAHGYTALMQLHFWEVAGAVALIPVIAVAIYLGLTGPFLNFEYRVAGITVKEAKPTVFNLWQSLAKKSRFLGYFAATTSIFTLLIWIPTFCLRVLSEARLRPGMKLPYCAQVLKFVEQTIEPWVMGHIWALCMILVYYIVSARNRAPIEVCAHFPQRPIGLLGMIVIFAGISSLKALAKEIVKPIGTTNSAKPASLPGGTWLWYTGAGILIVFWAVLLYNHGPMLEPEISDLGSMNSVLSRVIPVTNTRLHEKIPESAGDCQGFFEHRLRNGKAIYASPRSEVHKRCKGQKALAHMVKQNGHTKMEVTAKWATGLNTLEIMDILITKPFNVSYYTQQWNLTVTAKFADLHVWLKVLLGEKEWVNDYMCCDKAFHFTIQATVQCTQGFGFHPMRLHVLRMDPIEIQHEVEVEKKQDFSASYHVDYGRNEKVEHVIKKFLSGDRGKLLIKNSDGSTTDPLASASEVLNDIVFLNTGQQCVYRW